MYENELTYMNIHLDDYFHIMIVKTLMFHLSNKRNDSQHQLKPASRAKFRCCRHLSSVTRYFLLLDAKILQAHADNLADTGSFKSCYLQD